ncbi:MAG: S46 family peptidase [Myxococcaceae bacterium]|nr:S46 family peptidase [Myxococcaceae bacterium]
MRHVVATLVVLSGSAFAGEGKWTPAQVLELGPKWVKEQGFQLPLSKLWDKKKGTGLLSNAVQLPGCSGSFVSAEGLLITNHHCVVSILTEHSTPGANLFEDGYFAKTRADEKASKAYRIQVPRAFRDVTAEVRAKLDAAPTDLERYRALEAVQNALVAACEKEAPGEGASGTRCTFATFDGGVTFNLTVFDELSDVRLVWAPPRGVGEYGGEVDNWSWPRHTGDFSLLRAYTTKGEPYRPQYFFPLSTSGVKGGDAVAVLGYPGVSYRSLLAREVQERYERFFPAREKWTGEQISLLEEATKGSEEGRIAVSDELKRLANVHKNAQGQLAGIERGDLVKKRADADAAVLAKAPAKAVEAQKALEAVLEARLKLWEHDFAVDLLPQSSRALDWAVTLARLSTERAKPDLEREPGYQERDLPRLRERLARDQKRFFLAADKAATAAWVKRAQGLPAEQKIAAVDTELSKKLDGIYAKTKVGVLDERKKMIEETAEQLKARKDPLLELGFALDAERKAQKERVDGWVGATLVHRPQWRAAVFAAAGKPVAPDANSTLRVSFCRVKGYEPRDGVMMKPQTTLAGMLAKHTGKEPFQVPQKVLDAARAKRLGRWRDATLGDVPVAFLADCDTTGGNSGSPVIDGNGKLVGVNFDRVWENVANDFGYNPDVARNVTADARYALWQLEEVEGAKELLVELGAGPAPNR